MSEFKLPYTPENVRAVKAYWGDEGWEAYIDFAAPPIPIESRLAIQAVGEVVRDNPDAVDEATRERVTELLKIFDITLE